MRAEQGELALLIPGTLGRHLNLLSRLAILLHKAADEVSTVALQMPHTVGCGLVIINTGGVLLMVGACH